MIDTAALGFALGAGLVAGLVAIVATAVGWRALAHRRVRRRDVESVSAMTVDPSDCQHGDTIG